MIFGVGVVIIMNVDLMEVGYEIQFREFMNYFDYSGDVMGGWCVGMNKMIYGVMMQLMFEWYIVVLGQLLLMEVIVESY